MVHHIQVEENGGIAVLTVHRPEVLNVLNQVVLNEMLTFLQEASRSETLKGLILTGAGNKAFIAGADIAEMLAMEHIQMLSFCELGQQVADALESAPFVTVAAVNGYALGGGLEMALACDFIYASETATLGLPEVKLGIIPGFGGTQRLSRAVGKRQAKEMILTGKSISSTEAHEMGLVNRLFAQDQLLDACVHILKEIGQHPVTAITQAKRAINKGYNLSMREALALERNMCAVCFGTEERANRMRAFLEKKR